MKSRENLFGALVRLHGWHPDQANALIDDFAHELAEQIRNADYPVHAEDGADYAADVIDPHVQHASKEQP